MIDYDKLKEAARLAEKIDQCYFECVFGGTNEFPIKLVHVFDEITFDNIDYLLEKLRELTQPERKYKMGDILWCLYHEIVYEVKIIDICHESDQYQIAKLKGYGDINCIWCKESELYTTKSALIESQIEYWLSLREPSQASSISKLCPNCGNSRVHDGVCWAQGCSYKEPEFCINQSLKPAFIATNAWYKQAAKDEDEYCNVSGAKLGKHPVIGQMESLAPEDKSVLSKVPYEECQHESDICAKDNSFIFYNECAGNKYYTNITTNEQHCSCGVEADYPHKCKCKKCGEFYP